MIVRTPRAKVGHRQAPVNHNGPPCAGRFVSCCAHPVVMDRGPDNRRSLAIRCTAWLLMAVLTVGVAEVVARLIFPLPEVLNFSRSTYSPLAESAGIQERPDLAHAAFAYESAPDGARF